MRPMQGKRKKSRRSGQNAEKAIYGKDLSFAAAEAYKLLRTNILFALPDEKKCRVIGVTSASSGEGKSTTALNLAYMLAEAGERVLLIEGDMRLPTVSKRLGIAPSPGLSNVLAGLNGVKEALQESGLHKRLQIISSGDIPPNPSELLGSSPFRILLELLSGNFDFILIDLPPVTEVSDPLVASKLTDGMVVVVRQNYANRRALADTIQQLDYAGAKVLGFVLARADTGKGKKYYKRYGKAYETA